MKLKAALDLEVYVKTSFAAENKINQLQVISTMLWKLKVLKLVQIKVVGYIGELQLIMFCDN